MEPGLVASRGLLGSSVLGSLFTLIKVESAAGLEGLGEELAVEAVLVSSTSIIIHTDGRSMYNVKKSSRRV